MPTPWPRRRGKKKLAQLAAITAVHDSLNRPEPPPAAPSEGVSTDMTPAPSQPAAKANAQGGTE